jgi:hypothetical protein
MEMKHCRATGCLSLGEMLQLARGGLSEHAKVILLVVDHKV